MIRCRSCDHSRWVYVKGGALADELEWLTGFIRYGCEACGRGGWHRTHRRPTALDDIRRGLAVLARAFTVVGRVRAAAVAAIAAIAAMTMAGVNALTGTSRRLAAAADWRLVAIGLGAAVLVFTGFALGPSLSSSLTTDTRVVTSDPSPAPVRPTAPAPEPARLQAAQLPLSSVNPPHPTATSSAERPRKTAAPPKTVTRQVARVTAARDLGGSRRRPLKTPAVHRKADAAAPKPVVVEAVERKSPGAMPRFHGALAVLSEPLGAVVSVDGRVVGATPLVLKDVPVGSRVVRVESQGYERWSFAARVVANQEVRIVATLQRASDQ